MPLRLFRRRFARPILFGLLCAAAVACGRSGSATAGVAASESSPPSASASASGSQAASAAPAARSEVSGYPFTAGERSAVDDFLRRHPGLRVSTDDDRRRGSDGDAELHGMYGVYHPYFVRGDVDDDGVLDFVVGFVRKDSAKGTPWFSIVVFSGGRDPGAVPAFSAGTFVERDVSIARGDLAVDRDAIVITPDLAEDAVRRYRWDAAARAFRFVRDDDSETEAPGLSQTGGPELRERRGVRAGAAVPL